MPTKFDDSIIYKDENSRLKIELIRGATGGENLGMAEILVVLTPLYDLMLDARIALMQASFNGPLAYPTNASLSELADFLEGLDTRIVTVAIEGAKTIVKKYNLPEDWLSSFTIALLTNHLPVPSNSKISVYQSSHRVGNSAELLDVRRSLVAAADSLLIEIPYNTSVEQIRQYLSKNRAAVGAELKKLPRGKVTKRERPVMFWGWATALVLKNSTNYDWPTILALHKKIRSQMSRAPALPDTPDELRKLYARYVETLNIFEADSNP